MTDDRFCVKRVTKAHLHLAIVYERTKMDNVEQLRAKLTETKRKLKIVKKKMKKLEELLRPKEITERDYKLLRIYPAQQKCEKKTIRFPSRTPILRVILFLLSVSFSFRRL